MRTIVRDFIFLYRTHLGSALLAVPSMILHPVPLIENVFHTMLATRGAFLQEPRVLDLQPHERIRPQHRGEELVCLRLDNGFQCLKAKLM